MGVYGPCTCTGHQLVVTDELWLIKACLVVADINSYKLGTFSLIPLGFFTISSTYLGTC